MFKKILLYGLPVYLYGLELLLKAFATIRADSVAGPTLAGAGLGFLLPLTDLKPIPVDATVLEELKKAGARVYSQVDKNSSDLVWVCFFASLGVWMLCIYWTLKPSGTFWWIFNKPLAAGCIIFLVSVVLTEIKERI